MIEKADKLEFSLAMEREARASPVQGEVGKIFDFGRRGCGETTIPQSKIRDF